MPLLPNLVFRRVTAPSPSSKLNQSAYVVQFRLISTKFYNFRKPITRLLSSKAGTALLQIKNSPHFVDQSTPLLPTLLFPKPNLTKRFFQSTTKMASTGSLGTGEKRHKVTIVGSGNWGSTIAKIVAENTKEHPELFEEEVQMWVYEEDVVIPETSPYYNAAIGEKPQKLTSIINTHHENVKYLPGIKLPSNLVANPSLEDSVTNSSILVFNLPHQFIDGVCARLKGKILPFARAISCIKGVHVSDEGVSLFSEWIGDGLGIYCGALSGANVASEIAAEEECETTIAYDPPPMDASRAPSPQSARFPASPRGSGADLSLTPLTDMQHKDARGRASKTKLTPVPVEYPPLDHATIKTLFRRPYFLVRMVSDVAGVSLGGALKNIVALAAGFVAGQGKKGNTISYVIRVGLVEMIRFGKEFFAETVQPDTFTVESAGVADLFTSCTGGRNFRYSKMSVEKGITVQEIEEKELNGQKLQGTTTAQEVYSYLKKQGIEKEYPLFAAVGAIVEHERKPEDLLSLIRYD